MPRRSKQKYPRSGRKNRNNSDFLDITRPRNSVSGTAMQTPNLGPSILLTRRIEGLFDIITNGIAANFGVFNFSLNDLPGSSDFTALFQMYRIESIEIEWRPEYTELTDAALVSNAVNCCLNTAINNIGSTPTSVDDVLQNSNCSSSSITRQHKVRFRPCVLMDNVSPCYCFVSSQSPSTNWWGISYGIQATGIAMTFRSTAVIKLALRAPQ